MKAVPILLTENKMDLPPIDKSLLAKCGIELPTMPLPPVADYGLNVRPEEKKKERAFDCVEALKLFTPSEAVKMNYIPQMLIAVALQQTTLFVNYCAEHKISDFKKHTRVMRHSVTEYAQGLKVAYGPAYAAYTNYVSRYFERVSIDTQKMWFTIGNLAHKQIANANNRDIATHLAIIHYLLDFAEEFDSKMDKVIAEKMQGPVHRKQNPMLQLITAMCMAIEDDFGCKIVRDNDVDICIRVLANRAGYLADEIIGDEANVSKS
jgi:hypothetical protein